MTIRDRILALRPCDSARDWLLAQPADADPEQVYLSCDRGDWLVWLAVRAGVDRSAWIPALCDCVRLALPYAEGDVLGRTLEVLERYARGEATIEEVRAARDTAEYDAYAADDANVATFAAPAAAPAAVAAVAYVAAAAYAADDDYAVRIIATFAGPAWDAGIIRARIPWATIEAAVFRTPLDGQTPQTLIFSGTIKE
jgi:hypothetical protein